jgi:hypothetical protein
VRNQCYLNFEFRAWPHATPAAEALLPRIRCVSHGSQHGAWGFFHSGLELGSSHLIFHRLHVGCSTARPRFKWCNDMGRKDLYGKPANNCFNVARCAASNTNPPGWSTNSTPT